MMDEVHELWLVSDSTTISEVTFRTNSCIGYSIAYHLCLCVCHDMIWLH